MSVNKFFLGQPAGSRLEVTVTVAPPGSVAKAIELAVNGVPQGVEPMGDGIVSFDCPQPGTSYGVRIDLAWLAIGRAVTVMWLITPNGDEVLREPVIFEGNAQAVDNVNILVTTA